MKKTKKIFMALVLILVMSILPMGVLAEEEAGPDHVRIPITLVPVASEGSNDQVQQARIITGYVDFWAEVYGSEVEAHWTVTITSPRTYVTGVNLNVFWSQGALDTYENFSYSTFGTPTSVTNVAETLFLSSGRHSANLTGYVNTTAGTAYTVSSGQIYFSTPQ